MNRELLDQIQVSNEDVQITLLCVYCDKILLRPQQALCGHRFCEDCLTAIKKNSDSICPKCNTKIKEVHCDYAALREINELIGRCSTDERGTVLDHLSKGVYSKKPRASSNSSDDSYEHVTSVESEGKDDIYAEIVEMKRSINILNQRNGDILQMQNKFKNLQAMIDNLSERNETCMKEQYQQIQNFLDANSIDDKTQKELVDLRENYTCLSECVESLSKLTKQIEDKLSTVSTKIRIMDEEKRLSFKQFYDDVEYLTEEFAAVKTTNQKKVIKFYNKISHRNEKFKNLSATLPALYKAIDVLKKKVSAIVEYHVDYDQSEVNVLRKQMSDVEVEVDSMKDSIGHLIDRYPSSVFITVYFDEVVGMNMSLAEVDIFCQQLESTVVATKKELSHIFGSNRSSVMGSKRQLRRRPAFSMSDRKKKSRSRQSDEV